jgi:hypothetical protein
MGQNSVVGQFESILIATLLRRFFAATEAQKHCFMLYFTVTSTICNSADLINKVLTLLWSTVFQCLCGSVQAAKLPCP